jgi:integrase/recombinase XerD
MIRQGKGKKDRMVPIGQRALSWIGKYTRDARPTLLVNPSETTLFLTADGVSRPGEATCPTCKRTN